MKKTKTIRWAIIIIAVFALGFALTNPALEKQRGTLEGSQEFTIFSLSSGSNARKAPGQEIFHGYPVLGKVQVSDPKIKAALIDALYRGASENKHMIGLCFNPHHGVRAVKGWKTVDLVICFECLQIHTYTTLRQSRSLTSDSPERLFNDVLLRARVPLGKPRR